MFRYSALPFIFVMLLLVVSVSALTFEYDITYYGEGVAGSGQTTNISGFYSPDTSDIQLYLTSLASFNGSGTYETDFYSPLNDNFLTSSTSNLYNYSCIDLGYGNKNYSVSGVVEDKITLVHDLTYGKTYGKAQYIATTDQRYFTITNDETDTEGFIANTYGVHNCALGGGGGGAVVADEFYSANFGECLSNIVDKVEDTITAPASCGVGGFEGFYYTLFDSKQGNLTYYSTFSGQISGLTRHFIYKFEDKSSLETLCSASATCSGQKDLEVNTLYVYAVNGQYAYSQTKATPTINLTLDIASPNYVCGAYSECDETDHKTRLCVDSNGLQPDFLERVACGIIVLQNATFGFENYTTRNDIDVCAPDWGFFTGFQCVYNPFNTQEADIPNNWNIEWGTANRQDYFLQMTNDWASDGSRSLRMWIIPPGDGELNSMATSCINLSFNRYPAVNKVINDTFLLSFNVTFPQDNNLISLDAVACDSQVEKHPAIHDWNPFTNDTACPQKCYGKDCTSIPKSSFTFDVTDNNGTSVLGASQTREGTQDFQSFSYPLENVIAGADYTVRIALIPESRLDNYGQCIMVDNVRYEAIAEGLTESLVPNCQSRCARDGTFNYYSTQNLPNGGCALTIISNYDDCIDTQEIKEAVANKEAYCKNGLRYYYNDFKRQHEEDTCETGFTCEKGFCVDDDEIAQKSGEIGFSDAYDAMATVPWAFSLIILLLTIVVALFARETMVALFGFGQFIFVSSLVGLLSIYFALGEIVICVALIAFYISKPAQSTGGGG